MPQDQRGIDMQDAARDITDRTERMLALWKKQAATADKWYAALEEIAKTNTTHSTWPEAVEMLVTMKRIAHAAL